MASSELIFPASVIAPVDLAHAKRQLEATEERLHQASLRAKAAGKTFDDAANARGVLAAIAKANDIDLDDRAQRRELIDRISQLESSAPVVTISFAVDPSDEFMAKIVSWFRINAHPNVLIRVGLQPSITAGCRLRTPGKLYDFSLRNRFNEQRPMLVQRLRQTKTTVQHTLKAPSVEVSDE